MRLLVCPNCESGNQLHNKFCSSCGFDLKLVFCPSCRKQTPLSEPICQNPKCGASLRKKLLLLCKEDPPPDILEESGYSPAEKWHEYTIIEEVNSSLSKLLPESALETGLEALGCFYDAVILEGNRYPIVRLPEGEFEALVPFRGKWESASPLVKFGLISGCLSLAEELRKAGVWGELWSALWSDGTERIILLDLKEEVEEAEKVKDFITWWRSLEGQTNLGECFEELLRSPPSSLRSLRTTVEEILEQGLFPSITSTGLSDIGLAREINEDDFVNMVLELETLYQGLRLRSRCGLFMICDGMGGHEKGEVASSMAVRGLGERFTSLLVSERSASLGVEREDSQIEMRIEKAIKEINDDIFALNQGEPDLRSRMGTTLVALLVLGHHACMVHVGDSRLYMFDGQDLVQLTEDHSVAMRELRLGNVATKEEADALPDAKSLTQAIGPRESSFLHPEVSHLQHLPLEKETLFLLCSDGLTDLSSDEEIKEILAENEEPGMKTAKLIDKANEKGGTDNITVILVSIRPSQLFRSTKESVSI